MEWHNKNVEIKFQMNMMKMPMKTDNSTKKLFL